MASAVLFDLFETLVTESGAQPPRVSAVGREWGLPPERFRVEWAARRQSVVVGQRSLRAALAEVATSLGREIPSTELDRVVDRRVRAKAEILERIEPEIIDMVRLLSKNGFRLAVISNCFREDVTAWEPCKLAPYFDNTVFSFEVGHAKPDSAIYLEACRRVRVSSAKAVFVGDGISELQGAERAGIRAHQALWFLRRWPHFEPHHLWLRTLANATDVMGVIPAGW